MEDNELAWSSHSWRMPAWLWLNLAAMAAGLLHILVDMGVGLFPMRGTLAPTITSALLLISLIHVWWCLSLAAGAQGNAGGVASVVVLGLGWTLLTNGSAIVFCPPICPYAAPVSDIAHISSLALGIIAPVVSIWALWRARVRVGWVLPIGAFILVVATIWSLANSPTVVF